VNQIDAAAATVEKALKSKIEDCGCQEMLALGIQIMGEKDLDVQVLKLLVRQQYPSKKKGKRVKKGKKHALKIAFRYGSMDGAHHKTWVIDQMVRCLTGKKYKKWVKKKIKGGGRWEEGI